MRVLRLSESDPGGSQTVISGSDTPSPSSGNLGCKFSYTVNMGGAQQSGFEKNVPGNSVTP